MKVLLILSACLLAGQTALAVAVNPKDEVIACARRLGSGGADIFYVIQSKNLIVYENTSGGREAHELSSKRVRNNVMTLRHDDGLAETVQVDLVRATAKWFEDNNPRYANSFYTHCASFSSHSKAQILAWLRQIGLAR